MSSCSHPAEFIEYDPNRPFHSRLACDRCLICGEYGSDFGWGMEDLPGVAEAEQGEENWWNSLEAWLTERRGYSNP